MCTREPRGPRARGPLRSRSLPPRGAAAPPRCGQEVRALWPPEPRGAASGTASLAGAAALLGERREGVGSEGRDGARPVKRRLARTARPRPQARGCWPPDGLTSNRGRCCWPLKGPTSAPGRCRWPPNGATTPAPRPPAGPPTGVFLLRQNLVGLSRGQRPHPPAVLVPSRGQQGPRPTVQKTAGENRPAARGPKPNQPARSERSARASAPAEPAGKRERMKAETGHSSPLPSILRLATESPLWDPISVSNRRRVCGPTRPRPREGPRRMPPRGPKPKPAGRGAGRSYAGRGRGHVRREFRTSRT